MKKTLLILIIFYLSKQVFPQWINFNAANTKSLDASLVSDIVLSGNNYIWFATNQGLIKHDLSNGTWTRFSSLPNNFVYDIQIDNSQNIWAATNGGGVVKLTGQTLQTYNTDNGLAHNIVRSITKDTQGRLWFATYGGGISRFNGSSWLNYGLAEGLPTKYFYSAFCDSQGNLWFGTSGQGVVKFNGITWQSFKTSDGLVSNTIIKIYEDSSHRLWFCGQGGISIFDGINFQNLTLNEGLSDNLVYTVMEDNNGNFRIGTENGLNIWDGVQMSALDTSDGLANNSILCIAYDQTGKYWYGHTQNGASCYNGSQWINYGDANGLINNQVYKVVRKQDGTLWFATGSGITRYDGVTWKTFTPLANTYYGFNCMDLDLQGNIWAYGNNYNKLYKFDGVNWQIITLPISGSYINISSLYCDNEGNIWLGYYCYNNGTYTYGVLKHTNGNWTNYNNSNTPISTTVKDIFQDSSNSIWVATSNGVHRKTLNNWTSYTTTNGLADNNVMDIAQDQNGNMWFACSNYNLGGVSKFDGTNWITYRDQLHTKNVTTIFFDSGGKLWIAGNYQNSNYQVVFTKFKNGFWEYQNSTSGLPFTYNYKYIYEDPSENIWVCSSYGISTGNLSIVPVETDFMNHSEPVTNYPNPFSFETKIKFNLEQSGNAEVQILNLNGKIIRTYSYNNLISGENEIVIKRDNLSSGIYIYRISDGKKIISKRMTIL